MTSQIINLDVRDYKYELSKYINEFDNEHVSPALLKFLSFDTKNFNDVINENKKRAIKDTVTDSFVSSFFNTNPNVLKMLVDYQYHLINFSIFDNVNYYLMKSKPKSKSNSSIPDTSNKPLQYNEHIITNFKGGSTMFYVFNNIISSVLKSNPNINPAIIDNLKKNFKISDIDLSVSVNAYDKTFRYYQLESIISHIILSTLEELSIRLEFILLYKIAINIGDTALKDEIKTELGNLLYINNSTNNSLTRNNINIVENPSKIYQTVDLLKEKINAYKYLFNPLDTDENVRNIMERIMSFFQEFIEYNDTTDLHMSTSFKFKTLDMFELALLNEFLTYLDALKYKENDYNFRMLVASTYLVVSTLLKYLLNDKYNYLLENLYNDNDLKNFFINIEKGLKSTNDSLVSKAVETYKYEIDNNIPRPRMCETQGLVTAPSGDNYYPEYKYLSEERSGILNIADINPANINTDNIKMSGRQNFILIPHNSSYYPYLLVSSDKTGKIEPSIVKIGPSTKLLDFKKRIGNKTILLNDLITQTNFDDNQNNIHFVSMNKSIMMYSNSEEMLSFNLFRIKFNIVLKDMIENIDVLNGCSSIPNQKENAPSEFLDVGLSSKFDGLHNKLHSVEEENNCVVFNIDLPEYPGLLYDKKSRITSYNIRTMTLDLSNILFNQNKIPWLDTKYNKRLIRLLFYILNVSQDMFNTKFEPEFKPINQINVITDIINKINLSVFNINDLLLKSTPNIISSDDVYNSEIENYFNKVLQNPSLKITIDNIKYLLENEKELEDIMIFKELYTYASGLYTCIPIYTIIIYSFKKEINETDPSEIDNIINKYSKMIQTLYGFSSIEFELDYYIDLNDSTNPNKKAIAKSKMNKYIVNDFIKNVGGLFGNIKATLATLENIFDSSFVYRQYNTFGTNF